MQFKEHYIRSLIDKLLSAYFRNISKKSIIEIAKMNKVLYQLGQLFPEVQKSNEWIEVSMRRIAQMEELIKFNEVANNIGLKYVVIKTFRFPGYVPDDVDILVHPNSQHLIQALVSKLTNKHGYSLRSKGTTEMTIRKVIRKTYVDFDIHANLGAGPYIYLDAHHVFENSSNIELRGESIPVVNQEFEFIICAAHAIMKEFELTLADLLTFIYLHSLISEFEILENAKKLGLTSVMRTFWKFSQYLINNILLEKNITLPYRIPIYATILAYIENAKHRMKLSRLEPFKELLSFPCAKGVKKLIGL